MAIVVEILQPTQQSGVLDTSTIVADVLLGTTSPIATTQTVSVADAVTQGGTVANVSWGYDFPDNPIEGQIFIKVVS